MHTQLRRTSIQYNSLAACTRRQQRCNESIVLFNCVCTVRLPVCFMLGSAELCSPVLLVLMLQSARKWNESASDGNDDKNGGKLDFSEYHSNASGTDDAEIPRGNSFGSATDLTLKSRVDVEDDDDSSDDEGGIPIWQVLVACGCSVQKYLHGHVGSACVGVSQQLM